MRRLLHTGLAQSWLESPYASDHDYISILEDNLQVSPHFFTMLHAFHHYGALDSASSFCLYPGDIGIVEKRDCSDTKYSPILYLSPSPCPWGIIWRRGEWRKFVDWVFIRQEEGELPFVKEKNRPAAKYYNSKLRSGVDVHLSYLWRYNTDFGIQHLYYSFSKCGFDLTPYKWEFRKGKLKPGDVFLSVPHITAGESSAKDLLRRVDTGLLQFDCNRLLADLMHAKKSFLPARTIN